ncbi:FAD:protein FMN transferase [Aminithiophilus ramosus]|uniref:FAD:protein FMN transferase n=2 Tax=Synergistales TaxID=649776 RepID=A0A9Q7A7J4_9BACT|nr:FAD:protein FMN transferase [Aminithiophilus ramosus]QTX32250.1 FAD:protein FMN transferase [Aminithiophilus ramosus]QVL36118.1 FAD:protein FMN transferase [Synergistota bacterium]
MTRRSLLLLPVVLAAAIAGILLFRAPDAEELRERRVFLMGTTVTVRGSLSEPLLDETIALLGALERRLSAHLDDSEIGRVNADPSSEHPLSPETAQVLARALYWARRSDGAFDPTVRPLTLLWNGDGTRHRPPSPEAVAEARRHVGWDRVRLDGDILRLEPSMGLDLGGIAKGYGADEAVRFLRDRGVTRAIVDLGGNVVVIGDRPGGGPWRIGIQDPQKERGERLGVLEGRDLSVVTSGNYERFFDWEGKRWGHIVDPATGWPSESDLLSVTVVCEASLDGDALATALFVLGRERALSLKGELEKEGYAFILVGDGLVTISPSLESSFRLESTEYDLETR